MLLVSTWALSLLPFNELFAEDLASASEPTAEAPTGSESDEPESAPANTVRVIEGDARLDTSTLQTTIWRNAIRRATEYPYLRSGGQVTLIRVLEGDKSDEFRSPRPAALAVNGVRLFIPGVVNQVELAEFLEAPRPATLPEVGKIQLTSIKLVVFDDFPNGGGMYKELSSGDFVLIEHINSTRREAGADPLTIGSLTHQHVKLRVPVPPSGELGIAGDVVLFPTDQDSRGRIIAEVIYDGDEPVKAQRLSIGPVVVGGIYGRDFEFNEHGFCSTNRMSPGRYKIHLPDFDVKSSRWNVTVKPNSVTYLRFRATSQKDVRLENEKHIAFTEDG
jgi:hypothetical protein